ncbi:MAG: YfhO family protein [Prevotella sp.]|nr:YfhO family protein [Prevotella sp.]MCM1074525.1 YfhO family protein [Ruminococcus sp.]
MMIDKRKALYILLAVAFMAIVSVLFFYPGDIEGRTLDQSDMRQGLANGQEAKAYAEQTGHTPRWTNSILGGMPTFQMSPSYEANSLLDWVNTVYGLGLPAPANLLFAMMAGFFIMGMCMQMRWYVSLFGAVAWAFSTYFIIIIGAGHIWKFVTLTYIPPTIGGIWLCYRGKYLWGTALAALFGSLQLIANHPQMSYYFGFVILAVMGAAFMYLRKEKRMRQWLIGTACVAGAGVLALAADCASLYNTMEYSKETIRNKATLLSPTPEEIAAQEEAGETVKSPEQVKYEYVTQWSYSGDETFTLLVPNAKGGATIKPNPNGDPRLYVTQIKGADFDENEAYWLDANGFTQYFGNQPMTNGPVYVGIFVLALAVLAMFICRGSLKWWLFGVTILSILFSWGDNFETLTRALIDYLPGYGKFRAVSSILVVAEFTIPVLAMMALSRIIDICTDNASGSKSDILATRAWLERRLLWVCGTLGVICLLLFLFPSLMGSGLSNAEAKAFQEAGIMQDPQISQIIMQMKELRLSMVSTDAIRSFIFLLFGTAVAWLYVRGTIKKSWAFVAAILAVCFIDLYSVNKRYVNYDNFSTQKAIDFEPNAADEQIFKDKDPNFRVFDVTSNASNHSAYYHKTVGGYHATELTRYSDLMKRQIQNGNWNVLNMLNTKYIIQEQQDENGIPVPVAMENPDALGNAWFVGNIRFVDSDDAEMQALDSLNTATDAVANKAFAKTLGKPSAPAPGDYIKLTNYTPDKLTYKASSAKGGVAVFSEVYFPWGWTAVVDGKPAEIARVNYTLRGLRIPAGNHEIAFNFDPESLHVTNTIGVVAVIIIYLLLAAAIGVGVYKFFNRRK